MSFRCFLRNRHGKKNQTGKDNTEESIERSAKARPNDQASGDERFANIEGMQNEAVTTDAAGISSKLTDTVTDNHEHMDVDDGESATTDNRVITDNISSLLKVVLQ